MSDAVVVLDCPFCGSEAYHGSWFTRCRGCHVRIEEGTTAERQAMWNRRVVVGGKPEAPGT